MLIIDTIAAVDRPLDPDVRRLLVLRFQQMGGAYDAMRFIVVEAGDTITSVEGAIGFPLVLDGSPTWEWAERHGSVIEVAFVFGDAAEVLLVPERDGINADLIALLRLHGAEYLDRQNEAAR